MATFLIVMLLVALTVLAWYCDNQMTQAKHELALTTQKHDSELQIKDLEFAVTIQQASLFDPIAMDKEIKTLQNKLELKNNLLKEATKANAYWDIKYDELVAKYNEATGIIDDQEELVKQYAEEAERLAKLKGVPVVLATEFNWLPSMVDDTVDVQLRFDDEALTEAGFGSAQHIWEANKDEIKLQSLIDFAHSNVLELKSVTKDDIETMVKLPYLNRIETSGHTIWVRK